MNVKPIGYKRRATEFHGSIEQVSKADLPSIVEIANSLRLDAAAPQKNGFLISDFTTDDYSEFYRLSNAQADYVYFLVAKDDHGQCIGFLLAYSSSYIMAKKSPWRPRGTEHSIINLLAPPKYSFIKPSTKFYVIKQIGIRPDKQRDHVGRELYATFLDMIEADYVFSAIVTAPANPGSEAFHGAFGFVPIMQCSSFSKARDAANLPPYTNHVWLRPSLPRISTQKSNLNLPGPSTDLILKNFEHVAHLYRHEDNLNWTKLKSMITALLAFLAVTAVLIREMFTHTSADRMVPNSLMGVLIISVGFLGTAILLSFVVALRSGLFFMHSHKQILRIIESYFRLLSVYSYRGSTGNTTSGGEGPRPHGTSVPLLFISPLLRVPGQSISVALLRFSPLFVMTLWVVAYLILVASYFFPGLFGR